ncbi:hypothetical protein EBU99_06720 [bacterium]|nr:hypothetical protein [bacterium]
MSRSSELTAAVRARLQYVCDSFFCGDVPSFARFLGFRIPTLTAYLQSTQAIPVDVVMRIAQQTDIRADWLLSGTEPVLKTDFASDAVQQPMTLARSLNSLYPVFSDFVPATAKPRLDIVRYPRRRATKATDVVAGWLYAANGHKKPVVLFVDLPAAQTSRKLILQLLDWSILTGLIYTGRAVRKEVTNAATVGLAGLAKIGAQAGVGFGEAVQRWGELTRRSPLRMAFQRRVSFAADATIGEMIADLGCAANSAEAGAAFGACAYTDLLVVAAQLRELRAAGGVFLSLGSSARAFELLTTVLPSISGTDDALADFLLVFFGARLPDAACKTLRTLGGNAHFLKGDLEHVAEEMRLSCVKVFDGITDDCENDRTDN